MTLTWVLPIAFAASVSASVSVRLVESVKLPDVVAVFVCCPPPSVGGVITHSNDPPTARVVGTAGEHPVRLKTESVRVTFERATLPVLVKTNLNWTAVDPAMNVGPVGLSASSHVAPLSTDTYFST